MLNLCVFLCAFAYLTTSGAFANILLIGNNTSLSFNDVPAKFGRPVTGSGEHGTIFLASPLDACSPLTNTLTNKTSGYVLIVRGGGCDFVDKVRKAQDSGFKAAIIYNDKNSDLFPMGGKSSDIHIHAVFVTRSTGLQLQKYVGVDEIEVWLVQNDNSAVAIMAVSFLALLAMSAALATCCFVRTHRIIRNSNRPSGRRVRESGGMSSDLVKAIPSVQFTEDLDDNCTSATCAICLDDYNVGDKIRVLPCRHKFHMFCVDSWLTSWRTFCPVCKRDVATTITNPPATERTPLLSSTPASVASSSSLLSSARSSSYVSSRPMQIGRSPTFLPYNPRESLPSYRESLYPSSIQSSLDIRNASSSYRSRGSHFNSNSFVSPSRSPFNSIYTTFYSNSGNGSSSYIRSSSQVFAP